MWWRLRVQNVTRIRAQPGTRVRAQSKTEIRTLLLEKQENLSLLWLHRRPLRGSLTLPQHGSQSLASHQLRASQWSSSSALFRQRFSRFVPDEVYLEEKKINSRPQSPRNRNQTLMTTTLQWVSLTAMVPQACHSIFLSLSLFICEMGTMIVPTPLVLLWVSNEMVYTEHRVIAQGAGPVTIFIERPPPGPWHIRTSSLLLQHPQQHQPCPKTHRPKKSLSV